MHSKIRTIQIFGITVMREITLQDEPAGSGGVNDFLKSIQKTTEGILKGAVPMGNIPKDRH